MSEAIDSGVRNLPGRPRSAEADRAILDAVVELIAKEGFANLSMDAVAARAGVGKATIYRRWANREELVLEALGANQIPTPELPGRSLRDDLLTLLYGIVSHKCGPVQIFTARLYAALLAEGARNPDFIERYRKEVTEPRRKILVGLLKRAQERGEIGPDVDLDSAREMLTAPLFMRLLHLRPGQSLPPGFIERLVDTALKGIAASE